jgi:hypothetical protein
MGYVPAIAMVGARFESAVGCLCMDCLSVRASGRRDSVQCPASGPSLNWRSTAWITSSDSGPDRAQ